MNPLKVMIVDDEWLAREELKTMLQPYKNIDIVAEASAVAQAADILNTIKPDVIFLDVQMPGATGFDLLEKTQINADIIFITAYDRYAIKAFEVNALDYLLKPINKERLSLTIDRLLSHERSSAKPKRDYEYDDVVYVLINGSLKFIKISLLKCIVAEGNYSYIYYRDCGKDLVSKTLQEWELILPAQYFIRIHRSTIVNFEYVERVQKCPNYTHLVYIRHIEEPFDMSRRYAARLNKRLTF